MNTLSEHDLKHIKLIEKKIGLFESHKLDLFDLVCDLTGLLNILEAVEISWKEDFRSKINYLEMIHDSIEDGSISEWRGSFEEDLHNSVSKLKTMTLLLLDEYLKISDPNVLEMAIEVSSNWLICPQCNDAWESNSTNAMVVCPKCERALHNPRGSNTKESKQ